ncbi:restriction endonuclease subunit S [Flavobacterium sp. U410]
MENSLIQNINNLRNLPKDWEVLDYDDVIIDVSAGNMKTQKSDFLNSGKIAVVDQGKELIAGYTNNENTIVKSNNPYIVFGDHTRIIKYIDFKFAMGADGTKVLKAKSDKKAVEKYIYYFFKTLNIPETGYNRHYKYLKKSLIPLPPLATQQKIATILDQADALIQNNRAIVQKYDALTQSLFLDMFGDPVKNEKGWEVVNFEQVLSLKRGYDLPIKERNENGNIPVFGSNGILGFHNISKRNEPCLITGRSGSIGFVHKVDVPCWPLNTTLYSYLTNNNNIVYLEYLLRNFKIERFSHGAGVPTLDRKLVHKENIINVNITLQNQFAERVALIEAQKQQAQLELAKSEELFASLLQRAFKGELV